MNKKTRELKVNILRDTIIALFDEYIYLEKEPGLQGFIDHAQDHQDVEEDISEIISPNEEARRDLEQENTRGLRNDL